MIQNGSAERQFWRGWPAGQASPFLAHGMHLDYPVPRKSEVARCSPLGGPAIRAPESTRKDGDLNLCQYVLPISTNCATSLGEVTPHTHGSPLHFTAIPTPASRRREGTRDVAKRRNNLLDQLTAGVDLRTEGVTEVRTFAAHRMAVGPELLSIDKLKIGKTKNGFRDRLQLREVIR